MSDSAFPIDHAKRTAVALGHDINILRHAVQQPDAPDRIYLTLFAESGTTSFFVSPQMLVHAANAMLTAAERRAISLTD